MREPSQMTNNTKNIQQGMPCWANTMEPYVAAFAETEAAWEKTVDVAREAFNAGSRALFAANIELRSFTWRQYMSMSRCMEFSQDVVAFDEVEINGSEV